MTPSQAIRHHQGEKTNCLCYLLHGSKFHNNSGVKCQLDIAKLHAQPLPKADFDFGEDNYAFPILMYTDSESSFLLDIGSSASTRTYHQIKCLLLQGHPLTVTTTEFGLSQQETGPRVILSESRDPRKSLFSFHPLQAYLPKLFLT